MSFSLDLQAFAKKAESRADIAVKLVVSIGEVNPAGTVVLYDLHLRA